MILRRGVSWGDSKKTVSVGADVTSDGRLFQRRHPATGNTRSPTVDNHVRRLYFGSPAAWMTTTADSGGYNQQRAVCLQLLEGFQWNLAQMFIMWVGIAKRVSKVRGQRWRSYQGQVYFSNRGLAINLRSSVCCMSGRRILTDDVVLRLTCDSASMKIILVFVFDIFHYQWTIIHASGIC